MNRDEVNEHNLKQAVQRTRDLLLVSMGTKDCPGLDKIEDAIRVCLNAAKEYPDQDLFQGGAGFMVKVARDERHWDLYEVLVPATPRMIQYHEEEP